MSFDLYFWPSGTTDDPQALGDRLAEEEADGLRPDERVGAFRAELLRRWPELADMISPWHTDLDRRQPWGRTDLADRYLILTLPYRWAATDALPALAGAHGLDCYDPQSDRLVPPDPRGPREPGPVAGWVGEEHVVRFFQKLSSYIGYRYDDADADALIGALDDTDDESADAWFDYPLAGTPPLTVRLAQARGGSVVSVRVEGEMDTVLAARVDTLLDVL